MTSRWPFVSPTQPEGMIASERIFCDFGAARTSAMSTFVEVGTSRPVDESACGSMSTTSVGMPRL